MKKRIVNKCLWKRDKKKYSGRNVQFNEIHIICEDSRLT